MAETFITDLNYRERERYSRSFEMLSKISTEMAAALRSENDEKAALMLALVDLLGPSLIRQLLPVFEAAMISVPESPEGL
jgi:hypothetical protein